MHSTRRDGGIKKKDAVMPKALLAARKKEKEQVMRDNKVQTMLDGVVCKQEAPTTFSWHVILREWCRYG